MSRVISHATYLQALIVSIQIEDHSSIFRTHRDLVLLLSFSHTSPRASAFS
jgi:hypothetical protein